MTAFFRLALPMSVPAIAALAIFQFLFVWNDLLVALIYLGTVEPRQPADDRQRSPTWSTRSAAAGSCSGAAAFMSMALPLVVFFGLQRYFVRGIIGGAVKG